MKAPSPAVMQRFYNVGATIGRPPFPVCDSREGRPLPYEPQRCNPQVSASFRHRKRCAPVGRAHPSGVRYPDGPRIADRKQRRLILSRLSSSSGEPCRSFGRFAPSRMTSRARSEGSRRLGLHKLTADIRPYRKRAHRRDRRPRRSANTAKKRRHQGTALQRIRYNRINRTACRGHPSESRVSEIDATNESRLQRRR